jgi:hypothetical protein
MGVFDTYNGIQLKVGEITMANFKIGHKVPIDEGVYLAPQGVVVVLGGKLAYTSKIVLSKWGAQLSPDKLLAPVNPYVGVVNDMMLRKEFKEIVGWASPCESESIIDQAVEKLLNVLAKAYEVKER